MEHRAELEDSAETWKQTTVAPSSLWVLISAAKEANGWTDRFSLI